jgi:hypothetical protein
MQLTISIEETLKDLDALFEQFEKTNVHPSDVTNNKQRTSGAFSGVDVNLKETNEQVDGAKDSMRISTGRNDLCRL